MKRRAFVISLASAGLVSALPARAAYAQTINLLSLVEGKTIPLNTSLMANFVLHNGEKVEGVLRKPEQFVSESGEVFKKPEDVLAMGALGMVFRSRPALVLAQPDMYIYEDQPLTRFNLREAAHKVSFANGSEHEALKRIFYSAAAATACVAYATDVAASIAKDLQNRDFHRKDYLDVAIDAWFRAQRSEELVRRLKRHWLGALDQTYTGCISKDERHLASWHCESGDFRWTDRGVEQIREGSLWFSPSEGIVKGVKQTIKVTGA